MSRGARCQRRAEAALKQLENMLLKRSAIGNMVAYAFWAMSRMQQVRGCRRRRERDDVQGGLN
jgi:hypothetical protein